MTNAHAAGRRAQGSHLRARLPENQQVEARIVERRVDLSGAAADVGKDAFEGAKLAIEVVNARGGVLGRKLEMRHQDNGTNPQKSVDQATAMVRDGAKFLMAPQASSSAIAVNKAVSGKLKVPTCVSTSTNVYLVGIAMTPFGKFLDKSVKDLTREAVDGAFRHYPTQLKPCCDAADPSSGPGPA